MSASEPPTTEKSEDKVETVGPVAQEFLEAFSPSSEPMEMCLWIVERLGNSHERDRWADDLKHFISTGQYATAIEMLKQRMHEPPTPERQKEPTASGAPQSGVGDPVREWLQGHIEELTGSAMVALLCALKWVDANAPWNKRQALLWHPVSEIPKEEGFYLVRYETHFGYHYSIQKWTFFKCWEISVTHWAKVPPPEGA